MFELGSIVAGLKLPTKTIVAICIATAILLFADDVTLGRFGLSTFVAEYRTHIGTTFVVSFCIVLTTFVFAVVGFVSPWVTQAIWVRQHKGRLHRLSPDEKEILSIYIHGQTRSQILPMQDGTVNGLVVEKIIFRSSNLGSINGFAYNIQPWAWEYLNKNPHLLD